jgi:hypothetical protein
VAFLSGEGLTQVAGVYADAGATVVFGASSIRNNGDVGATLESAALVGAVPTEDAAVVEVRVRDVSRGGDMVGAGTWPFENLSRRSLPLKDYVVQPGEETELLFIVRVHTTGQWDWPRTQLRYSANGETHEISTSLGFEVCPTAVNECELPD